MKNIFRTGYIAIGLTTILSISTPISAQETTSAPAKEGQESGSVTTTLGIDLVNQYIWRGQDLGNTSLQPTLGVEWKGLSLTAWGSVGITRAEDTKELDFTLSYTHKGLTLGLTDYWFGEGSYFQYKSGKTTHIWEGYIGYDFGFLSATWYTNFAGDDGLNNSLERAYSSYFELKAPFRLAKLDWEGSVGLSPWATTTYGNTSFACTNVGLKATKDFLIKQKYHLPIFVGLNANPDSGKVYLLCGLGFSL
ncbi:MAG: hypothetical protein K5672_09150 [Bacteroidaceae bacterium]|nr:hypothetical protein [Bacteroidaceae bacterium]